MKKTKRIPPHTLFRSVFEILSGLVVSREWLKISKVEQQRTSDLSIVTLTSTSGNTYTLKLLYGEHGRSAKIGYIKKSLIPVDNLKACASGDPDEICERIHDAIKSYGDYLNKKYENKMSHRLAYIKSRKLTPSTFEESFFGFSSSWFYQHWSIDQLLTLRAPKILEPEEQLDVYKWDPSKPQTEQASLLFDALSAKLGSLEDLKLRFYCLLASEYDYMFGADLAIGLGDRLVFVDLTSVYSKKNRDTISVLHRDCFTNETLLADFVRHIVHELTR